MQKKKIILISLLIGCSLIGLVGIQLYWVNSAIKLKEQEFQANVFTALQNVVLTLERVETINHLQKFDQYAPAHLTTDSINHFITSQTQTMVKEFDKFFDGKVMEFSFVSAVKNHEMVKKELELVVRKNTHIIISGPNGIGKSTLLEKIAMSESVPSRVSAKGGSASGTTSEARNLSSVGFQIAKDIKIGYYKQDFSNFDFNQKAYDALKEVMVKADDHHLRSTAAGFLLDGKLLDHPIAALSEGQKGLLSFCRLVLMKPGLLILDEPTNHINFRHLPIIAKALDEYQGAMLMVSHIPDFVSQIRIDETIDLSSI